MTPEQRALARHALGLPNVRRRSYRNRYFTGGDHPEWDAMCVAGEAVREPAGRQILYSLTATGAMKALDSKESLDPEDFGS